LIVGIDDYPDPKQRLEGCVNDAFTMSSVLQECGFDAGDIRLCLNHRATARDILDRLEWLVDAPLPGDELVFYYSGHGARIPEYGDNGEPDRHIEVLCPVDFDWTLERSVSDKQIFSTYAQLPWDTRLALIFDCCHSGGVHRDGAARARGVTPPDDIRHRELRWDRAEEMWVERDFQPFNGATERLGRGSSVRRMPEIQYQATKDQRAEIASGPYLPLIIEACAEDQLSYEYRHGSTSYGVFTYCLAETLRRLKGQVTFKDLVEREVRTKLERLGYR
jgi:hypothetical protein